MANFTTIWRFVENELMIPIPTYIKNILKCCGFENCYSISTIEENDIAYFEQQVRKGALTKFIEGSISENLSPDNVLEGYVERSGEEFEFSRGHQKLIITIARTVKENLEKNGIDGFELSKGYPLKARKNYSTCKLSDEPYKRRKNSSVELGTDSTLLEPDVEPSFEDSELSADEIVTIHRNKLVKQAVVSLKKITPAMYKEKFEIIQGAIPTMVTVKRSKKKQGYYTGQIKCPYCKGSLSAFHTLNANNKIGTWNSSNFGRHLENVHIKKLTKKRVKRSVDVSLSSDNDDDIATKPNHSLDTKSNESHRPKLNENVVSTLDSLAIGSVINMKDVEITASKTVFSRIVNYSDTDESGDDKDCILIEVPSNLDSVMMDLAADKVVVFKNEPLESLEDISIHYPDSLYQSDLDEDKGEAIIESNGAADIEQVPMIRNGYKSANFKPIIYTVNTCAFDSIFLIYASLYFDDQNYRKGLEPFLRHSNFAELIKKYFDNFKSNSTSEKTCELYDDRNVILNEIFSGSYYNKNDNMNKNRKYTFINCKTGIGGLFGQICFRFGENFASAIELKMCSKCATTTGKILPFVTIDHDVDLREIQKYICLELSQERLCTNCKRRCVIDKIFNDTLVLEVEPITAIEFQKPIPIQNLTNNITVGEMYEISAVIEFDPVIDHFRAHVKRKHKLWKTYDDMTPSESDTDISKEIFPYLLFYSKKSYQLAKHDDFKTTLLSFFEKNKLRKPLIRKILPNERHKIIQLSKPAHASSTTASAERNKKLEMGWKH